MSTFPHLSPADSGVLVPLIAFKYGIEPGWTAMLPVATSGELIMKVWRHGKNKAYLYNYLPPGVHNLKVFLKQNLTLVKCQITLLGVITLAA
jgi:hypothetical protein